MRSENAELRSVMQELTKNAEVDKKEIASLKEDNKSLKEKTE